MVIINTLKNKVMPTDIVYKALIPINNSVIYGIIMKKKHIILTWHYFKLLTINNSVTYGH